MRQVPLFTETSWVKSSTFTSLKWAGSRGTLRPFAESSIKGLGLSRKADWPVANPAVNCNMSKTINDYKAWSVSLRFEIFAKGDRAMHLPIIRRFSCSTTV